MLAHTFWGERWLGTGFRLAQPGACLSLLLQPCTPQQHFKPAATFFFCTSCSLGSVQGSHPQPQAGRSSWDLSPDQSTQTVCPWDQQGDFTPWLPSSFLLIFNLCSIFCQLQASSFLAAPCTTRILAPDH